MRQVCKFVFPVIVGRIQLFRCYEVRRADSVTDVGGMIFVVVVFRGEYGGKIFSADTPDV